MHHLFVRLQLTWLTFAAVVAAATVAALGPRGGGVDVHFALSSQQFRTALQHASAGDAAAGLAADGISIKTVNTFRAGLAADMLFLVAYGLVLRKSVRFHPPHRWSRTAEWCAVATMVADAIENVGTLTALGTIAVRDAHQPGSLFVATAVAAIAKWLFAASVMFFLALRWHSRVRSFARPLRPVARLASLAFFTGAAGAILVAVSAIVPPIRKPAALAAVVGPALALVLQFRLLDTFGRLLRFVFLARVPLIVLAAIAAFGPIGLGPAASLAGGILDVPGAWGIAATTASCLVLAFACGTEVNMVRAYAWQRTFDPTLRVLQFRALASVVFWTAVTATASLIFSMAVASADVSASAVLVGVAGGLVAALLFLFVVELMAAMLTERKRGRSIPHLGVPLDRVPLVGSWLRRARRAPPPRALAALKKSLGKLSIAARLFGVSSGYIGTDRRLLPGHSFAAVQLLLSAAFYGLLLHAKWGSVSPADPWVPTAASIVLLLLLWSWALAGISFFLDRYRVPLFTSVIGLVLLSGSCKHTDHVVRLKAAPDHALASPGEILSAFPRHPLVVAAAGGGIQAGAWAARALQGIDEALGRLAPAAFRDRLALVTGVSGGSMGAMYYGAYRDLDAATATERSMAPSLDEVASALIGPDLLRAFWIPVGHGRGAALERSWASRLPEESSRVTLAAWADKTRQFALRTAGAPPFPAFLFDTTIVETGQAMAFATSQFPTRAYRVAFDRAAKQSPLAESANLVFGLSKGDETHGGPVAVEVATAARLSAAFPFVSPAATLEIDGGNPRFHLVDGGYYDNYGLVVTSQWLDDALEEMARRKLPLPADVGIVIIRSLVDARPELTTPRTPGRPEDGFVYTPRATAHGWAWQIIAPPSAFANGRTFGQWAGGNQVLRLLIDKWKARGVTIAVHLFDFPAASLEPICQIEPLSWKLTSQQKACIGKGWSAELRARAERLGSP
jgi:hypothetical protein